jgi:hypothetical protein
MGTCPNVRSGQVNMDSLLFSPNHAFLIVQEWDRNLDSLKLEETSNKNFGDILIEFQEEYEGNAGAKRVVFSGAVSHLICLIFKHCYHVVERG